MRCIGSMWDADGQMEFAIDAADFTWEPIGQYSLLREGCPLGQRTEVESLTIDVEGVAIPIQR